MVGTAPDAFASGAFAHPTARSTAAIRTRLSRQSRRRRAKVPRTRTGAAAAAPASASGPSMIAALGPNLAAEDPISPPGVAEDQRYHDGHADQHQDLAVFRRRSLPDVDALRHDVRIHADAEPGIGQRE